MTDQENMKMINALCNKRASLQACLMYLEEGGEVLVAPPVKRILEKAVAVEVLPEIVFKVKEYMNKHIDYLSKEIKERSTASAS